MRLSKNTAMAAMVGLVIVFVPACSKAPSQTKFANPEDAAKALHQALKSNSIDEMKAIFGGAAVDMVASGDPVSDRHDREVLGVAMEQSWRWAPSGAERKELLIGDEQWPFPAPLVRTGDQWQFDSERAKEEVLARRIGRNELGIIDLCRSYVDIQGEYAARGHDGKPAGLFAQRIRSTPGRQDGLYWVAKPGEDPSPLGDLAADAATEGYGADKRSSSPFWGYHFRILTAQGPAAPGGKKTYVVKGEMSGGFALVAFPATYGSSGVMTFIVNQDGVVYEKDLGPDTANQGNHLADYNPDQTWTAVRAAVAD